MNRWTPEQLKRIDDIQTQVARLGQEFREIVNPTKKEIQDLLDDVEMNPHVYISYFEDDGLFISENVFQEVRAREES